MHVFSDFLSFPLAFAHLSFAFSLAARFPALRWIWLFVFLILKPINCVQRGAGVQLRQRVDCALWMESCWHIFVRAPARRVRLRCAHSLRWQLFCTSKLLAFPRQHFGIWFTYTLSHGSQSAWQNIHVFLSMSSTCCRWYASGLQADFIWLFIQFCVTARRENSWLMIIIERVLCCYSILYTNFVCSKCSPPPLECSPTKNLLFRWRITRNISTLRQRNTRKNPS